MKHIFFFILVFFVVVSCTSTKNKENIDSSVVNNPATADSLNVASSPIFKFETDTHNFGKVTQGEKVAYTFIFTNIGKSNLIIDDAVVSCGCTVPKYSKDPVKPGQTGEIEVVFNTTGKKGMQYKTIQVFANTTPNVKELRIKALVEDAK